MRKVIIKEITYYLVELDGEDTNNLTQQGAQIIGCEIVKGETDFIPLLCDFTTTVLQRHVEPASYS